MMKKFICIHETFSFKKKAGYSLVELLIALSVIGLILSVGSVSFRDYTRKQNVVSVARQIVADLRLAQQQALSGNKPTGCVGTLVQYEFVWNSSTEYVIAARCNAAVVIKTVVLPANTTIDAPTPAPPGSVIGFKPIGQGTNLVSAIAITARGSGTSYTQTITINPTGDIK